MIKRRVRILLLLILISCSCSRKHDGYSFIPLNSETIESQELIYPFKIDTLCIYDTFISCKFNSSEIINDYLKAQIIVQTPTGQNYYDTLSLPLHRTQSYITQKESISVVRNGKHIDIEWPYRSNIISDTIGKWNITINPISNISGIYGIGFSYVGRKIEQ